MIESFFSRIAQIKLCTSLYKVIYCFGINQYIALMPYFFFCMNKLQTSFQLINLFLGKRHYRNTILFFTEHWYERVSMQVGKWDWPRTIFLELENGDIPIKVTCKPCRVHRMCSWIFFIYLHVY